MSDIENERNDGGDVYVADPDAFDDDFDGELPGWTKPVGVISIVWGVVLVICGGLGTAMAAFQPQMMKAAAGQLEGGVPDVLLNVNMFAIAMGVAGLAWAILNIVAGVLTVGRSYTGRIVHLIWAVGAIAMIVTSAKMQLDIQAEIAEWIEANPDAQFTQQQQAGGAIGQAIGIVLSLFFLIWPAFCLFWFGFVKKTEKDFTGGLDLNM
jgi:hypothetical protein